MKELKDVSPSALVIIVTPQGDEKVAIEAFRNGARDSDGKLRRKSILPMAGTPVLPGAAASTVMLGQYHKIQQAVRYINAHYRADIRLNAAAREAGMSPAHFSRIFKKVMGLSYQDYVNDRRITKARNLLRTSPRSITEIADFLGFADATGFGRIFKKVTGQTPSAYRGRGRK